jgi:hypothetical protein
MGFCSSMCDGAALLVEAIFGLRAVFFCDCVIFSANTSGFIPSWNISLIDGIYVYVQFDCKYI